MNNTQKTIVELLENTTELTSQEIKGKTGITYDTIMRNMKMLELQGIVDVSGRRRNIEETEAQNSSLQTRRPWVNYYKIHKKKE